jgi:hypothetical protein
MPADAFAVSPYASNATVKVALAAATTKTVLQIATPATTDIVVVAWGISFDASAAGGEATVELLETDVAATVTSVTPVKYFDPLGPASLCVGGTSATGYNATAEGTITATRILDAQLVNIQTGYAVYYPPGFWPRMSISKFLRVRVNSPAVVNCLPWVIIQE